MKPRLTPSQGASASLYGNQFGYKNEMKDFQGKYTRPFSKKCCGIFVSSMKIYYCDWCNQELNGQ